MKNNELANRRKEVRTDSDFIGLCLLGSSIQRKLDRICLLNILLIYLDIMFKCVIQSRVFKISVIIRTFIFIWRHVNNIIYLIA